MIDLVKSLRFPLVTMLADGKTYLDADTYRDLMNQAADEIERLQRMAGAVTSGESFAELKEKARGII